MTADRSAAAQAIASLVSSLARVQDRVQRSADEARHAAAEVIRRISTELARRRQHLVMAQEALRQCQAARRGSCSAEHARVRRAEDAVRRAEAALRSAEVTQGDMNARLAARTAHVTRQVSQGRQFLNARLRELGDYMAAGIGGGAPARSGPGAPSGAAASGGARLRHPAGLPAGFAMVPLFMIDHSASTVTGPQDFKKGYSPQDLAWAFQAFKDVVLPGLASGATADTFLQRDQAAGFQGTHSYSMTHSQFLGTGDAIRLSRLPSGKLHIDNGQHRIWVARQYGFTHVPAWIP